jgi:hypothetical protein
MIRVRLQPDAHAFLARAEPWLMRAEMQNAMALQSARFAARDESRFDKPLYWATVEEGERIIGCAFRTPPYRLGLTALPLTAIPALTESVAAVYGTLSGVAGPEPAVTAFTAAWSELRGVPWSIQSRQQLLAHRAIVPMNEPPPGALRVATGADAGLARQWGEAFAYESGIEALDGVFCVRSIPGRRLYLWEDGAPSCMLGVLRETHDAAAIGVLYTPPALRERGYASAAVAAFSRHLLDRGLTQSYFCLDPMNVAADWICRRLGYGVVQETADIDFAPR